MTRKIILVVLMAFASVFARASSSISQSHGKIKLQQNNGTFSSIDKVYETRTEKTFAHAQAFLTGFKSYLTIPDAINCSVYLNSSINEFNYTQQNWAIQNETNKDKVFDTAHWISYNVAPSSRYCIMTVIDGYLYGKN